MTQIEHDIKYLETTYDSVVNWLSTNPQLPVMDMTEIASMSDTERQRIQLFSKGDCYIEAGWVTIYKQCSEAVPPGETGKWCSHGDYEWIDGKHTYVLRTDWHYRFKSIDAHTGKVYQDGLHPPLERYEFKYVISSRRDLDNWFKISISERKRQYKQERKRIDAALAKLDNLKSKIQSKSSIH